MKGMQFSPFIMGSFGPSNGMLKQFGLKYEKQIDLHYENLPMQYTEIF